MAGTSYEKLNYHKNKALKESGIAIKGIHILTEMESQIKLMKKTAARKDQP